MRCIATLSVLLAICFTCHSAIAQQCNPNCPPVEVNASVLGGGSVTIPASLMPAFHLGQPPNSPFAAQLDSLSIDMTKDQVCKILNDNKPANCSATAYPPAPQVKSASGAAWSGNGCGAGSTDPFNTWLSSYLYGKLNDNYSKNLNAPIKGRPDIDFTEACNLHDGWYTSRLTKARADWLFAQKLNSVCGGVSDSAGLADCNAAESQYQLAVDKYGDAAYAEDQAQYQCAAWGDSMKKDGCGSN